MHILKAHPTLTNVGKFILAAIATPALNVVIYQIVAKIISPVDVFIALLFTANLAAIALCVLKEQGAVAAGIAFGVVGTGLGFVAVFIYQFAHTTFI